MSVPIFTGGALTAQIKIATAQEEQTVARYGSVVLRAFGEVEVALTNEMLLTQRTLFDQRALEDRTTAVQIAAIKYTAGSIDLLSVLILQSEQLTTQASRYQAAQRTARQPYQSAPGSRRQLRHRACGKSVREVRDKCRKRVSSDE